MIELSVVQRNLRAALRQESPNARSLAESAIRAWARRGSVLFSLLAAAMRESAGCRPGISSDAGIKETPPVELWRNRARRGRDEFGSVMGPAGGPSARPSPFVGLFGTVLGAS